MEFSVVSGCQDLLQSLLNLQSLESRKSVLVRFWDSICSCAKFSYEENRILQKRFEIYLG